MKRLLIIASVMIVPIICFAQSDAGTLSIQPKIGINIAYYGESQATNWNTDTSPRIGIAAGVELAYQVKDRIGLSAGVIYSQQGENADAAGFFYWNSKTSMTAKTDYINFPVLLNIYLGKRLALKFGVQPGVNVKSGYTITSGGSERSGKLSEIGINIKAFDLAIPIGISYEFENIVLDVRYNLGVTNITGESDKTWNRGAKITVGYKFNL